MSTAWTIGNCAFIDLSQTTVSHSQCRQPSSRPSCDVKVGIQSDRRDGIVAFQAISGFQPSVFPPPVPCDGFGEAARPLSSRRNSSTGESPSACVRPRLISLAKLPCGSLMRAPHVDTTPSVERGDPSLGLEEVTPKWKSIAPKPSAMPSTSPDPSISADTRSLPKKLNPFLAIENAPSRRFATRFSTRA